MRRSALLALVLAAGCTKATPSSPSSPALSTAAAPASQPALAVVEPTPAPVVRGERTPLGDPPRPAAESSATLDRSSPAGVLATLQAAVARQDTAAIARLRAQTVGKATLDSRDLLRAKLDFLGEHTPHWTRVFAAVDPKALAALPTSGAQATLHVAVGGAAGTVDLTFVKKEGAWLAGF